MNIKTKKNIAFNNPPNLPDEIDLLQIFEDLWNNKIKIIIFSMIGAVIGAVIYFNSPKTFEVSTILNPAKNTVFVKYFNLNKVLENNEINFLMTENNIFQLLIEEFNDLEELRFMLLKKQKINNQDLSNLDLKNKTKLVSALAKSFEIIAPSKDREKWKFKFIWSDINEGTEIFNSAIKFSLENLQKSLINDLDIFANFIDFQNNQKIEKLENSISMILKFETLNLQKRVLHLSEQAKIARILKIDKNNFDKIDFFSMSQNSAEFDPTASTLPEYLRGYEALEKERDLILERSNEEILLNSKDYLSFVKEIDELNNDITSNQLREISSIIKTDDPHNWISYDFALSENKNIHNSLNYYLFISSLLGGMAISLFILINKAYSNRETFNK